MENIKDILIFGAHLIAVDLFHYLKFHHMEQKVIGFAVSQKSNNPDTIAGVPVKELEEYEGISKETLILIAAPEKFFLEIRKILQKFHYCNIVEIGNFGLAALENKDVTNYLKKNHPWMEAEQDVYEAFCVAVRINSRKMKFMSLAAYPLSEESMDYLKSIRHDSWLQEILDSGQKESDPVSQTKSSETQTTVELSSERNLQVFVVQSPRDLGTMQGEKKLEPWEIPLIGGADLLDKKMPAVWQGDNTGIHISEKNREYAEMTAVYWVWKNSSAKYKGISHYRRRYVWEKAEVQNTSLGKYDVILTVPRLVLPSVGSWFANVSSLSEENIAAVWKAVCKQSSDYKEDMERFLNGHILYPNNMVIARSDIYNEYCTWLFSILEYIEENDEYKELKKKQRYAAYTAELLTSLFFMHNRTRYCKKIVDYELLR